MLYPSELQPRVNRLLHFYYNVRRCWSFRLSRKRSNPMNSKEKDNVGQNELRARTEVS
jgi:hypothetical protein